MAQRRRWKRPYPALGVACVVLLAAGLALTGWRERDRDVLIGRPEAPTTTALPGPTVPPDPIPAPDRPPPEPRPSARLALGDGGPPGDALAFTAGIPVPDELIFVLVAGSDARPGEDLRRTRADSLHLLAVNPTLGAGTILGIPRDSWVNIPGHGRGKINQALALGGPALLSETVRRLTGLPVEYYVLTGFEGFKSMVDRLGGVNVYVERRMADRWSGAYFERGWHHFTGPEALAYARNRHDVPNGDFSRSLNQGRLFLAGLAKARAEIDDQRGLRRWIEVLLDHVELDVPRNELADLAVLGRTLDPARIKNLVTPGRVGYAGRQSVVYLGSGATEMFVDLRDDAIVGERPAATTTTTTTTTTPTTVPSPTTTTIQPGPTSPVPTVP